MFHMFSNIQLVDDAIYQMLIRNDSCMRSVSLAENTLSVGKLLFGSKLHGVFSAFFSNDQDTFNVLKGK